MRLLFCMLMLLPACGESSGAVESRSAALEDDQAEDDLQDDGVVVLDTEPGALYTELARSYTAFDNVDENDQDGDGVRVGIDPDDTDPYAVLRGEEIPCSGVDEDGDGLDFCPPDGDGDGVRADHDCDDMDATRHPFAVETRCDGGDENCDGFDDCDTDEDGLIDRVDLYPDDPTPVEEEPIERE